MRILPSLSLLTLFLTLLGCRDRNAFNCDRLEHRARAKGQDPRLYGIWYNVRDRDNVQAGKLKGVPMIQYSPKGHHDWGERSYFNGPGAGVWYVEGNKVHHGRCKDWTFSVDEGLYYKVQGDTLWLYKEVNGKDTIVNPMEFYLRLRE